MQTQWYAANSGPAVLRPAFSGSRVHSFKSACLLSLHSGLLIQELHRVPKHAVQGNTAVV